MITRAPSSFRTIFIASALFAVPFLFFAHSTMAATTTNALITITSPANDASTTVGNTVDIDFNATGLTTVFANISLSQNGTPVLQIATVNAPATQTSFSLPWTVPSLTAGTYTLTVSDGPTATTTGANASLAFIINGDNLAGPTPLVSIDPSQVVFDASTGSYNYSDPAQEAAFQAQVAALDPNTSSNQTNAAVGIIGDALVNTAGQCVGSALAGVLGQAIGQLGGAAATAPTDVPTFDVAFATKSLSLGPGQSGGLDGIANCISIAMIQSLSDSLTKWINNDFQLPDGSTGSAYLKNPTQFFQNLADVTAGQFLGSFSVNGINLCSNFSLPLRLNLLQQYSTGYNQQALCTLGTIVHNLSAFTGGDFSQGGWDGWLAMTQNPNNNYYGSYIQAANQLQIKLDTAKTGVQTDLTNGNGFLSYKKCIAYGPTPPPVNGKTLPAPCTSYQTVTPGSIVADAALKNVDDPREKLVVANSFNEVVTALVNSMITRIQNFASNSGTGL